jgi:hypothetical protein
MAHTLQIVYGSTTIDLSTGDYAVSYTPRDPGGAETVTENLTVRVMAANLADMQSDIRDISTAFEAAKRRRKTGTGDRVYIKFQESGDSDTYRSEIWSRRPNDLPGRVTILGPTMYERIFTTEVAMLRISWSRRGYWEDDSETELALKNGSGSGTGGITVVNPQGSKVINAQVTISYTAPNTIADSGSGLGGLIPGDIISVRGSTSNDGIYTVVTVAAGSITVNEPIVTEVAGDSTDIYDMNSYVHIDATLGTIPTPCRIEMTNNDAGADLQTVWIGNNYLSEPEDFAHILEAEDSDTGSNTANAGASSGQYRAYAGISTPEAKITGWTIPTETLVAADSAYFKVIARFFDGTNITDVKYRLRIYYASQILYDGPQIEFDDTYAGISRLWRELDTIQLPPYLLEGNSPTDLTLELWGISTSGGAETVNLDLLMLLPVNTYRKLYSISGVAQNSVLVDDGVLGIYYQTVSSELVSDITAEGEPIMLWPGIDNRIYFIQHSETANTADIDRAMSVRVYYRPRRVTL